MKTRRSGQTLFNFLSHIAVFAAIFIGSYGEFVIPSFRRVYASMHVDLPFVTSFVLNGRILFWVVAIATVLLLWICRKTLQPPHLAAICIFDVGLIAFIFLALYFPHP